MGQVATQRYHRGNVQRRVAGTLGGDWSQLGDRGTGEFRTVHGRKDEAKQGEESVESPAQMIVNDSP